MKNKKKLLLGVAAMGLVAVATGAVSTLAWYTAQSAAGASGSYNNASLATTTTSLDANNYQLNFYIRSGASGVSQDFSVQLSFLGDGTSIGGVATTNGTLYKGIYNSSGSNARAVALAASGDGVVTQQLRVECAWNATISDPADIAHLNGAAITGAVINASANAHLLASKDAYTSVSDINTAYIKVVPTWTDNGEGHASDGIAQTDEWSFAVTFHSANTCTAQNAITVGAMRIATNNPTGAEWNTAEEQAASKTYGNAAANPHASGNSYALYHTNDAIAISGAELTVTK